MISSLLGITAFLLLVGVANDEATFAQILGVLLVALILFALSALIGHFEYAKRATIYYMEFVDVNGNFKRVRAHTLAGRMRAIRDYESFGYTLYAEGKVIKE